MLVYRTPRRFVSPIEEVQVLGQSADPLEVLIGLGQLESGVADAISGESVTSAFRGAMIEAARRWRGHPSAIAWDRLGALALPARVELSVPEGYAWYALYPETYVEAAGRFYAERRPARVGVIGIRSIGTSLSAVVAVRLEELGCEVRSWTVRPGGHPFERRLDLSSELKRELASFAGAEFAIVDEGPGLSGSSMASVAEALSKLGIPDERISFFPSWVPDGAAFHSEAARRRWPRHRKYCAGREEVFPRREMIDLSAGLWRKHFLAGREWPAVQPQHERVKYLDGGRLLKFAGLGRFGRPKLERAEVLHAAGFTPRPIELRNGFLATEVVEGRPLAGRAESDFLETLARYLCFLRDRCPAPRGASFDELAEMIEVNTGFPRGALPGFRAAVEDAPAVAIDGRLLPHEWLETAGGYVKTDALDHHDDHFLPGGQPIAWDVAGAAVEFALDRHGEEYLVERCRPGPALPFYKLAYLAFRLGYARLAASAIPGTADARRFEALAARYEELILL